MSQELYVFAITAADHLPSLEELTAFEEAPVQAIFVDGLAAITTAMPSKKLRPRRSNLKIHHQVIDHLVNTGASALPFSFGAGAPSETIQEFIAAHRALLQARLLEVQGCLELTLRLKPKESEIFPFVLQRRPALQSLRDSLFQDQRTPSREEMIALGQSFASEREALRLDFLDRLQQHLTPFIRDTLINDNLAEEELASLVFLLPREETTEFEAAIDRLGDLFDDDLVIQLSPYLPPYSFADIQF